MNSGEGHTAGITGRVPYSSFIASVIFT